MAQDHIKIERLPLRTLPHHRLNSYNHHALAPWLKETGYLTPLYLHRREEALQPFNMARWLSPRIQQHMLRQPQLVLTLTKDMVTMMLYFAAHCDYDQKGASKMYAEFKRLAEELPRLPQCETGYFVRMSHCSPKDVDDGNLQAVHSVTEALMKLACSKRTVQALLNLHHTSDEDQVDAKVYFFPYCAGLDRLSEWRCYIRKGQVVAISQSRFYQANRRDIRDDGLREMVRQVRLMWTDISKDLAFDSCALDIYAQVHRPGLEVKLIEINPWGAHLGSGSLLFHWLDDDGIFNPSELSRTTVVRLVEPAKGDASLPLGRKEAYSIGRLHIIADELRELEKRRLEWVLETWQHDKFMRLPVPGRENALTTRSANLQAVKLGASGETSIKCVGQLATKRAGGLNHPRFRKLHNLYEERKAEAKEMESDDLADWSQCAPS